MSTNSSIEWTQATWNPVVGCTRASAGCDSCYAVKQTYRLEKMGQAKYAGLTVLNPKGERHFNGVVRTVEDALSIPLKRKKPTMYFVNSMSDLFHKDVPFEFIDKVFAVMALTPQHTYQVLTKRPERMAEYFMQRDQDHYWAEVPHWAKEIGGDKYDSWKGGICWPLPNVWLGTSVEDQLRADERIPHLLRTPAAVRFLSVEPLLAWKLDLGVSRTVGAGKEEITEEDDALGPPLGDGISWVIVGGESGSGARPCIIDCIRDVIEQCKAADVPVFVKQLGAKPRYCGGLKSHPLKLKDRKGGDMSEWPPDLRIRQFPRVKEVQPA